MATMAVEDNEPRCMVCSVDLSTRHLDGYSDKDLCANCKRSILDTFKRVYLSLTGMGQRTYAAYFGLEKT